MIHAYLPSALCKNPVDRSTGTVQEREDKQHTVSTSKLLSFFWLQTSTNTVCSWLSYILYFIIWYTKQNYTSVRNHITSEVTFVMFLFMCSGRWFYKFNFWILAKRKWTKAYLWALKCTVILITHMSTAHIHTYTSPATACLDFYVICCYQVIWLLWQVYLQ